jgi:predicted TIM-barrel fold metal-dependent hydrolase
MYASAYPHGESHLPQSAGLVVGWDMQEDRKRKLLWDNATRLYARAGLG